MVEILVCLLFYLQRICNVTCLLFSSLILLFLVSLMPLGYVPCLLHIGINEAYSLSNEKAGIKRVTQEVESVTCMAVACVSHKTGCIVKQIWRSFSCMFNCATFNIFQK